MKNKIPLPRQRGLPPSKECVRGRGQGGWARVKLHFVQLTRQEPLGSLQNSHFANAKPRFLQLSSTLPPKPLPSRHWRDTSPGKRICSLNNSLRRLRRHRLTSRFGSCAPVGRVQDRPRRQPRPKPRLVGGGAGECSPPWGDTKGARSPPLETEKDPLPCRGAILPRLVEAWEGVRGWGLLGAIPLVTTGLSGETVPPEAAEGVTLRWRMMRG